MPGPLVSVIVPTRNSAATLEGCLRSIRDQSYEALELVVVDNASTDDTVRIASELADIVVDQGPERSAQRNRGVAESKGDYVFIIDSDMILGTDVVVECVHAAQDGATAVTVPETSEASGLWGRAKALERSCYIGDETIEAPRFFARTSYLAHGGYDEEMTGPEDWDLPARMRRSGAETFGRTDAQIVHLEGHPSLRGLARKKYYYGRGFSRYIARNPHLAARQLQIVRPAFYRHRRRLMETPGLAAAMLWMKTVEFSAGGAGFVVGTVSARLSGSRAPGKG